MWWKSGSVEQGGGGGSYGVLRLVREVDDGGFNFGNDVFNWDGLWGWSEFRTFLKKRTFCHG